MREWFYCLIETKGNFYINVGIRNNRTFVQPIFSISMKKEDVEILKELRNAIGVGEIRIGKNASLIVRGIKNLERILEKISEEKFITSKKRDFLLWKEAVEIVRDYKHLSKEGFLRICEIRDMMNLRKKRKNYKDKEFFEKLLDKMSIRFEDEEKRKKISSSLRVTYSIG
ncbi:MAG: LAGLIDADG family homing endonuclease [Candidatus Aenigmatarchaeota archaeon]|jgi:hypothetical protein